MYIVDGIAYAGEQKQPIRAKAVRPLDSYKLLITFSNDERRVFDFAPLLEMPCYSSLKDKAVFDRVYVDYGTVCWNDGDIDIAPETIYNESSAYNNEATA